MEMNYKGTEITGTPQEFREFLGEKVKVIKMYSREKVLKKKVGRPKGSNNNTKKVASRMKKIHRIAHRIKKEHPRMKYIDCVKKAAVQYNKVHR